MTIVNKRVLFRVGDKVRCINIESLPDNDVAPPLILEEDYEVIGITLDTRDNQYLDVGLKSEYNFISSHETGEELKDGDEIHWCHPSRFIKLK